MTTKLDDKKQPIHRYLGVGGVIGAVVGIVIGNVLDNMAVGLAVGIGLALVVGAYFHSK